MNFDHREIEKKWQKFWEENKTFEVRNSGGTSDQKSFYCLDMFPYPSGAGLHVGHPLGQTATDIISRKRRMQGYQVLHPMGWDAFGLPAENYAIKTGIHPSKITAENIATFKKQIQSLGMSYDWSREFSTTDSDYYRWSQWLFLQFYKAGMLYETQKPMHWCPKCKVVCANEEVENGVHERCGETITAKDLKQWMFKITDYAERLLTDLNTPSFYVLHGWGANAKDNWFETTRALLSEKKARVCVPNMPNTQNPQYEEWKAHFEETFTKNSKNLWPQDICIGHSLGGYFLLRYLSEENVKISELILVAPATGNEKIKEIDNFFINLDTEKIKNSVEKITIFYSDNDPFISQNNFEVLAEKISAEKVMLPNREHFCEKQFPELFQKLSNLEKSILDWPEKIKLMQRHWIGKSTGAEVNFALENSDQKISVYTTRPDTLWGATYFVLSPEHPLVQTLTTPEQAALVKAYQKISSEKSELDRTELNKEKSGVFTGGSVINPANGEKVPVWIADYVLMSYGTGAIMAVPAHDERDFEFAQKYSLPIKEVVAGLEDPYQKTGGTIQNSAEFLNGLSVEEAIPKAIDWLEKEALGQKKVNYRLRDWIFTRQRYWGEPIPLVFDEKGDCYPLHESELPIKLPNTPNYAPSESGESPLAKITDWVEVKGDIQSDGSVKLSKNGAQNFRRETSTMPNWAGSNWYWLRFMDAKNSAEFCSKEAESQWGPVDLYVGGAEHAVLHLLYSRYWHKILYDMGLVSTKEPFKKLVNQGLILAEDGTKMSKSKGNVVNPDVIVEEFGADTLRCYEMFMGPFEQSKSWNTGSVGGTRRWLDRVWRLTEKVSTEKKESPKKIVSLLHKTIQIVGEHIEEFRFNTAISQMMVLTNELTSEKEISSDVLGTFAKLLAPFAPHLAEEIWSSLLQKSETISYENWPEFDEKYLVEDSVTYAVQVNGKIRGDFEMPINAKKDEVLAMAKSQENVEKWLEGQQIVKEIFVPNKLVGFVVK